MGQNCQNSCATLPQIVFPHLSQSLNVEWSDNALLTTYRRQKIFCKKIYDKRIFVTIKRIRPAEELSKFGGIWILNGTDSAILRATRFSRKLFLKIIQFKILSHIAVHVWNNMAIIKCFTLLIIGTAVLLFSYFQLLVCLPIDALVYSITDMKQDAAIKYYNLTISVLWHITTAVLALMAQSNKHNQSGFKSINVKPNRKKRSIISYEPIAVSARPKAWAAFVGLNTRVMGSNPTRRMGVCVRLSCLRSSVCR
jgi:hypothetical protein